MGDPDVWPMLLDMNRDDCKRVLRRLELEAYSNLVSVLRAQGSLTAQKRRLLQSVAQTLSISEERHKAECRRAVNSEKLATIAKHMGGTNTGTEWAIEGRRLVPLLPRLVPQTAFTAIADKVANMAMTEGAKLPLPTPPVKRRLQSPPIDERLLEPSVPEASKTHQLSAASPSILSSPCDGKQLLSPAKSDAQSLPPTSAQLSPQVSIKALQDSPEQPALQTPPSNSDDLDPPVKGPSTSPSSLSHLQLMSQSSQPQVAHCLPSQAPSQVVLLVKKEDRPQDERLARKRPRSASLDVSLNIQPQSPMMPPPMKKEALSPLSPSGMPSHLAHPPATISPQSHSQLVQQQTLQAAAAAAAAAAASNLTQGPAAQTQHPQQQKEQQLLDPPPSTPPQQAPQQAPQTSTSSHSTLSAGSSRTITIPSQGTVKLSLSSTMPNSGTGIPSGTHKVIIVSSTTPSILQRSLSVPVVKTLSTSAPSQPCTSTVVLNTAQQSQQLSSGTNVSSGNTNTTTNTNSQQAPSTLPSKIQGKIISQSTPKARPRANSIVIPVTPNQANVMNSVAATTMQLKSAFQASKQTLAKPGDTSGLKILPIANMGPNTKILPKPPGSGPIYVVSSTSSASPAVSMVSRTVPSGARVMTFTSSLPKVAVSTTQGGAVLSMTSKPVQTLQLAPASGVVTSSGSTPLSSSSGKPNVIVVQKGSAAFGRGVSLSHAGKEVVGKVLLGSKALTSLSSSQANSSVPSNTASQLNPTPSTIQVPSQMSQSSQTSQPSPPAVTSAPTRVVTVQKLPSAVVQGTTGSSNVIVLDLSQEQLNNLAFLNEILTSSILQSSNTLTVNHDTVTEANNTSLAPAKSLTFSHEQSDISLGALLGSNESLLVEGLDNSIVQSSVEESSIASEFSALTESSHSLVLDDCPILAGVSSSNQTRRCSDIFTTALSNANLNLNDFLDDSIIDGIQTNSVEDMKMQETMASTSVPDSNSNQNDSGGNLEDWVSEGNGHDSIGGPDLSEV